MSRCYFDENDGYAGFLPLHGYTLTKQGMAFHITCLCRLYWAL